MAKEKEIIKYIKDEFEKFPDEKERFLSCEKSRLTLYHHSLGRMIRNKFALWNLNWEPEIKNGVDCSPNHPDAVSMRLIEQAYEEMKNGD